MSGIEVAGLALAVLPILVSAAENAEKLAPKRTEVLANLCFEITILHMTLTKLAKDLPNLSADVKAELISSKNTREVEKRWKSKEVLDALQARLGSGLESFRLTLASTLESLDILLESKSLGLIAANTLTPKQSYAKLATIRDQSAKKPGSDWNNRVRFKLYQGYKSNQILQKITENNARLEKIASWSSDALGELPAPVSTSNTSTPAVQLRPFLRKLYYTIEPLWACDCRCGHEARLAMLHKRDYVSPDCPEGKVVNLEMLISMSSGASPATAHRWLQNHFSIALQEDSIPKPKGVRWASSPNKVKKNSAAHKPLRGQKIRRLCETVTQAEKNLVSARLLLDADCLWDVISECWTSKPLRSATIPKDIGETSLLSLLQGQRKFKTKERRILSVILANSLLHFCESPWLSKAWSKEHISFFMISATGNIDVRDLFLSIGFRPRSDPSSQPVDETANYQLHPNPSVLALGILLLEIELHSTIESNRTPDDLDQ